MQTIPVYFQTGAQFNNLSIDDCVMLYKQLGNEVYLQDILYKLKGTISYYISAKCSKYDESDMIAMFEDKLLDCIERFDPQNSASFKTFYCRCLDNMIINLYRFPKTQDESLDYEYEKADGAFSKYNLISSKDTAILDLETSLLIEEFSNKLDDNEHRVCEVIIKNSQKLSKADIARELELTVPAISNILHRIAKKFVKHGVFCENF